MKNIGIIINPNAKKIRTGTISIRDFKKFDSSIIFTECTSSVEDIDRIIAIFKNKKIESIGVVGGDGTLHNVVTSAIKCYGAEKIPPFLVFKGGTMDNVARSIGNDGNAMSVLERLQAAMKSNRELNFSCRDTIRVGSRYCFLFGAGFVTNFLDEAYGGVEKGLKQNLKTIFKAVRHAVIDYGDISMFRPLYAKVKADGKELSVTRLTGILSGTVEHIGMGFTPLSRSMEKSGMQHAIITGAPPGFVVRNIRSLKIGRKINHPLHFDDVISSMEIISPGSFKYTMDGDLYSAETGSLTVAMGPQIKFIKI